MRFYSIAIGTELLNGRRSDLNTPFLINELTRRDLKITASFIIEDSVDLIKNTLELVKKDSKSVLFCFGGIGATPDDYTRVCAADVFTGGRLELHKEGINILKSKFVELDAQKSEMVNFPVGAKLIKNPVNEIPAFQLEDRFFFTPGFPAMTHPMIANMLEQFYPVGKKEYRFLLTAFASEGQLVDIMSKLPQSVTLSCLPDVKEFGKRTSISISSHDRSEAKQWFNFFARELKKLAIEYKEGDLQGGI